jgi:hypothetical protein
MIAQNLYGLWPMGYGYKIPANQLGKSKNVCLFREYGLYLVYVRRESTVCLVCQGDQKIGYVAYVHQRPHLHSEHGNHTDNAVNATTSDAAAPALFRI